MSGNAMECEGEMMRMREMTGQGKHECWKMSEFVRGVDCMIETITI